MFLLAELTRADYALIVSIGSLAMAGMALFFQMWNSLKVDRARLELDVTIMTLVDGFNAPVDVVRVGVVNAGKRPTQLNSLWLAFSRDRWRHRWPWPRRLRRDIAAMVFVELDMRMLSTQLPLVLDVGGEAVALYKRSAVHEEVTKHGYSHFFATAGAATTRATSRPKPVTRL